MWRKYGDLGYSILVLAIFVLEVLVMAALTGAFVLKAEGRLTVRVLASVVGAAVGASAVGLLSISAYILAYHFISAIYQRQRQQRLRTWTEKWGEAMLGGPRPPRLGGRDAWEALLNVREAVSGPEAEIIVAELRFRGTGRMLKRLRSSRKHQRLEALEELARARLPETFNVTLAASRDTVMFVRSMALRAAARVLAVMGKGADRDHAIIGLAAAIQGPDLPTVLIDEVLLLLEDAAPAVIEILFSLEPAPPAMVKAAIGHTGRPHLAGPGSHLRPALRPPDPALRPAVLPRLCRLANRPALSLPLSWYRPCASVVSKACTSVSAAPRLGVSATW